MNAFKLKLGLVAASSLSLILTACPSGTNTGGATTVTPPVTIKYAKLGMVSVTSSETLRTLGGSFFKAQNSFAQPASATGLAADTCIVSKSAVPGQMTDLTTLIGSLVGLDAGAELSVKKAAEMLATLKQTPPNPIAPNLKFYSSDFGAVIPDVSGATLEIPGAADGFPAITTTLPNEMAAFTFGPKMQVTKDTIFEWTQPTSEALLTFSATSGIDADAVAVTCTAKDDGSFAFPASTKAEMDSKGFTSGSAPSARKGISKFVTKEDALLIVTASRSSIFVP
jgi:hypothetical protein